MDFLFLIKYTFPYIQSGKLEVTAKGTMEFLVISPSSLHTNKVNVVDVRRAELANE